MHRIELERRLSDMAWRIWYVNNSSSLAVGAHKQLDSGQSPVFLSGSPLFWFLDGVTAYNNTIITTNHKHLATSTLLLLVVYC